MKLAIIGHGSDKFTGETTAAAVKIIESLLELRPEVLISGRSPRGGVDIWAESMAIGRGIPTDIKAPTRFSWSDSGGYKERNLAIAAAADEVHVIVVATYPPGYVGMSFTACYHCAKHPGLQPISHVKSGACWTAWEAAKLGKQTVWHII